MGRFCRKALALLVSTALAFSMVSATALTAFADGLAAGRADLPRATTPVSSQIGTTTWTLDADGTLTIAPADGVSGALPGTNDGYIDDDGWREEYRQAERLVFEGSIKFASSSAYAFNEFSISSATAGASAAIAFESDADCFGMFAGCSSLVDVSGLSNWDMSTVSSIEKMFSECVSLVDIAPLANWNTASMNDLSLAFIGCSSLSDLSPLANWDTSNVTMMYSMFEGCSALASLAPLAKWNTSSLEYALSMFQYCESLTDISGVSNWDLSSVTYMPSMFYGCGSLTDISALSSWQVSAATNIDELFCQCYFIEDLSPIADWDVSSVLDMSRMFSDCSSLTDLSPIADWDVSSVLDMSCMFSDCLYLTDLSPIADWDVSAVTDMSSMFSGCSSLIDLSPMASWDVSAVTDMEAMFSYCSLLRDVSPLKFWSISETTNRPRMFSHCASLADFSLLASWDVSQETDLSQMFSGCSSLVSLDFLKDWDVSSVSDMSLMFYRCSSLTDLSPLANWEINPDVLMWEMFGDCTSLIDVSPLSGWNTLTSNADIDDIFDGTPVTKFVLGDEGFSSLVRQWGPSVGDLCYDGKHTGKWVSADAVDKGPLTMAQIMEGWDPATMSGTWVAEEKGGQAGAPSAVDLSQATVAVAGATYTGSALTPAVTVRCGGAVLRPGADYTVAYADNVNAGRGTATVTGRGGYAGTKAAEFTIAPADLSRAKLTGLVSKPYAKGRAIKQAPAVKLGALTLKSGRDFAVSYKNNRKVGTATVTVTGKGNFAGAKAAKFKIVRYKQPMTAKAAKGAATAKAKTLKKKAVTLAKPLVVKKAKGKVAYANASTAKAAKAFKVNARTGKVTLPKGTKKGTYTVKIKVAANGAGSYAYGERTVAVKVRVK